VPATKTPIPPEDGAPILMTEISPPETFDTQRIQSARLKRFFAYWEAKRGDASCPHRKDLDPLEIPYALGFILIAEAVHEPEGFRIRLMGGELAERFAIDLTGRQLSEYPEPVYRDLVRRTFKTVLDRRQPVLVQREIVVGTRRHRYEGLNLPLSSNDGKIDTVVACLDFADR